MDFVEFGPPKKIPQMISVDIVVDGMTVGTASVQIEQSPDYIKKLMYGKEIKFEGDDQKFVEAFKAISLAVARKSGALRRE